MTGNVNQSLGFEANLFGQHAIDGPTESRCGARVIRLKMPPDEHRSTLRDDLAFGKNEDVQWSPDGSTLAFISTSRDHKHEWLRVANASTGDVRTVYEESVATEYEGGFGGSNFRYLPETHEFIWYSQLMKAPLDP